VDLLHEPAHRHARTSYEQREACRRRRSEALERKARSARDHDRRLRPLSFRVAVSGSQRRSEIPPVQLLSAVTTPQGAFRQKFWLESFGA